MTRTQYHFTLLFQESSPSSASSAEYKFVLLVPYDLESGVRVRDLLEKARDRVRDEIQLDVDMKLSFRVFELKEALINGPFHTAAELEEKYRVVNNEYLDDQAYRRSPNDTLGLVEEPNGLVVICTGMESPRSLHTIYEGEGDREKIAEKALKRDAPSTGATVKSLLETQTNKREDAVYNHRPLDLSPPPIQIYHPVFAQFLRDIAVSIDQLEFNHDDLDRAYSFIKTSANIFDDESRRLFEYKKYQFMFPSRNQIITEQKLTLDSGGRSFSPAAVVWSKRGGNQTPEIPLAIIEVKNEIGMGGSDPIAQAQCDYLAFYSSKQYSPVRQVSCCPALLIGIAGPHLKVAGAIFADRYMSEDLTPYTTAVPSATCDNWDGPGKKIREIARLFHALDDAVNALDEYYAELTIPSPITTSSTRSRSRGSGTAAMPSPFIGPLFPSFVHPKKGAVRLTYRRRMTGSDPSRAVFEALAQYSPKPEEVQEARVVVKFAPKYCGKAHEMLASKTPRRAPEVWYCERVESVGNMYVVVMSFVAQRQGSRMRNTDVDVLCESIKELHDAGFVYGDLRRPNVLLAEEGPLLIDFDWCGKDEEARYPDDINLEPGEIDWHGGVRRSGIITKEHDKYMLKVLSEGRL